MDLKCFKYATYDIRGHGESKTSQESLTYPLLAEDLRQLLHQLEIPKAYLCGYSTGGAIVLEAMISHPDRYLGGIVVSGMSEMSDRYNRTRAWIATHLSESQSLRKFLACVVSAGNADMRLTLYQNTMRIP